MKLLALTRYDRLGASSRLRTFQYIPHWQQAGMDVEVMPLLDDAYLSQLYGSGKKLSGLGALAKRTTALLAVSKPDVIWIEKEVLPWLPAWCEAALLPNVPIIVDYDDALFHRYDRHRLWPVRALLGRKIDVVMRRANAVVAGNHYLAERAQQAGAKRIEIVPTVIDWERYQHATHTPDDTITIGWVGSPQTAHYLKLYASAFNTVAAQYPQIQWRAIGARDDQLEGTPFIAEPWSEEDEVSQLQQLSIGIMPLSNDDWARGKCGYKLIQYMACGVPVAASAVGVNNEIVSPGSNGLLAADDKEWQTALTTLIHDAPVRKQMGQAGQQVVQECYTLQVQAPKLTALIQEVAAC